jgi:flagellar hook-basal body complex protein FliE
MAIQPIGSTSIPSIPAINPAQKPASSGTATQIGQTFETMLNTLNESQLNSDALVEKMARGESVDLHQVMIGMEENNVNFNVAIGIRDKLIEAYREVMRMQV